jgi:hypothetical protein
MGAVTVTVTDLEGNATSVTVPYVVGTAPAPRMLIGTTPGSVGIVKAVAALPKCQVVRCYQSGLPTTIAASSELTFLVNSHIEPWYTFNTMPTQAQFQTCVTDWVNRMAGRPFWWTLQNEVDKSSVPAATFVQRYDQLQVWAEAVPGYLASKVRDQTSFTSYMLTTDPKTGQHPHGDPNTWVPSRPTRLGIDCYVKEQWSLSIAFVKSHNLPWAVLEYGCGGVGGDLPTGMTQAQYDADRDAGAKEWARQAQVAVASYPPAGMVWFANTTGGNARSDTLVALPKTAAYLSSLIA